MHERRISFNRCQQRIVRQEIIAIGVPGIDPPLIAPDEPHAFPVDRIPFRVVAQPDEYLRTSTAACERETGDVVRGLAIAQHGEDLSRGSCPELCEIGDLFDTHHADTSVRSPDHSVWKTPSRSTRR